MSSITSSYKLRFAVLLVPLLVCVVGFFNSRREDRQLGMLLVCVSLTSLTYIAPLVLLALYYHFFFSGTQTARVDCRRFLDGLGSDAVAAVQRAALCYLLYLMNAPLPVTLLGFLHFSLPCVWALVRFAITAVAYVSEGPVAAASKSHINVMLWQRVVRGILSGGKDTSKPAAGGSTSRYASLNSGKATSSGARKTSLRAANVECRVVDEGKHFNRVARGCLLT